MDSLTNIYNRYGFDELAAKMIAKNPKTHFVAALFDIDDFKFINDIYGHGYGDKALKCLADSMKAFFPSDAILGRNGGDEFCVLLPNYTFEEAETYEEYEILKKQLEQLPNKKDTWFSELGKGCIDTIFYSKGIRLNKYETINVNGVSDHDAVFAEFDI